MSITPIRHGKRRTIDHIRQDLANAVKSLRRHAEKVGVYKGIAIEHLTPQQQLDRRSSIAAHAEYCSEMERLSLKLFNAAVREARKEVP